jgi:hypothetical protein
VYATTAQKQADSTQTICIDKLLRVTTTRCETKETQMGDPPRDRHTGEDARLAADRQPAPGMPRWVKLSAVIVAVLVLLLVVVMLLSGSGHGPQRHRSDGAAGPAPRSSVSAAFTMSGGGLGDQPPSKASH